MKILFLSQVKCNYSKALVSTLKRNDIEVTHIMSSKRGDLIPIELNNWEGDYILSFRTHFIIKNNLISKAKYGAINFHPGPPEHPGSASINFALLNNDLEYGVTAHYMNESVDNGEIIEVIRFPISVDYDLNMLVIETHYNCFKLINKFIDGILKDNNYIEKQRLKSMDLKWKGKARKIRDLDMIQNIPIDITKEKLELIIKSTHTPEFPPFTIINGYKFILRK